MPRPPVVKTRKLAEAEETGKNRAELKAWKNEPIEKKLYDLAKLVIKNIDPMEAMAIVGSTIIVHEVILKMSDFYESMKLTVQDTITDTSDIFKGVSDVFNGDVTEGLLHGTGGTLGILGKLPFFGMFFPEFNIASDAIQKAGNQLENEKLVLLQKLKEHALQTAYETEKTYNPDAELKTLPSKIQEVEKQKQQIINLGSKDEIYSKVITWMVSFAIAYYAVKHGLELLNVAKMFFGKVV